MATRDSVERGRNVQTSGVAGLLSPEPLIIYTPPWQQHLGLAEELGRRCSDRPVTFLLPTVWHCDERGAGAKAAAARAFRQAHPKHRVIFVGNTPLEAELLAGAGADAFFSSQNIFVRESVFRPLPDEEIMFDAVYNARPVPEKRHQLAADIASVAYVCGGTSVSERPHARTIVAQLAAKEPRHTIINELEDGLPAHLDREFIVETLARSAVGLCLSAVEGAMYSSVEYMLAGLPIVSTPSLGGREVFFDPDYCLVVDSDPRTIREAVEALRDRRIPREYIRERTLAKLAPERHRFLAFVEDTKAKHGVARDYNTNWPFSESTPLKWRPVEEHARVLFGWP